MVVAARSGRVLEGEERLTSAHQEDSARSKKAEEEEKKPPLSLGRGRGTLRECGLRVRKKPERADNRRGERGIDIFIFGSLV